MTDRCEPPPEWLTNDDIPYHWVCHKHDDEPSIARFRARGTPPLTSLYVDDELASEANGWRYLAPCRPDDATERARLETENAMLRAALDIARQGLLIVSGQRQCVDNLLSNKAVALEALRLIEEPDNA